MIYVHVRHRTGRPEAKTARSAHNLTINPRVVLVFVLQTNSVCTFTALGSVMRLCPSVVQDLFGEERPLF